MIPLKLYMRNFMCYREQTLDMSGIHLACLTGDNGHGKSAILDAITWALWGYSRVGARRDDELIHLGQSEMEVEYEFRLGETPYRVIRKRDSRKRGRGADRSTGSLELHGWDRQADKFRPLTEPTLPQTQQAIIDLLRMDYTTFINSAFLLQGRADEFTLKPPAERKRVLGSILNLDIFSEYEQAAKQAAQDKKAQADQKQAAVIQIDQELDREPEYRRSLLAAQADLTRLQAERAAAEEAHEQVRARLQAVEVAQQQLDQVNRRVAQAQAEVARLDAESVRYQARLHELEEALQRAADIERGYAAYQQAMERNEQMNADLGKLVSLNEQHRLWEQQIALARHELEKAQQPAAARVSQLSQVASGLQQEGQWQAVRDELARLYMREQERDGAQQEIQTLTGQIGTLQAEHKQAEKDAVQIKDKIELLKQESGAACPLCGQPLAKDGCAQLLTAFEVELVEKREAYRQRNAQINESKAKIEALQTVIREVDLALRDRTALQRQEATLEHALREARTAQEALPTAQQELSRVEAQLAQENYALEARTALQQVEEALSTLGYDAQAHRQVQADIQVLRSYEAQIQTLREARSGVETVQLALSQLNQQRQSAENSLNAEQKQAAELNEIVQQQPALQQQASAARQALETAHDQEQQANLRLGAARTKVEHCTDLRQQRVKRLEEEQQLREEQAIYKELQDAFGKNGIQAMLIETAIPEIEEEANRLLARMTNGRMQVRFDTQRDTKKGDTIETLDIHISDELGTRSYETFSGGERYRVNFAIRVALSKMLARRAGAQLEMLIIDEGFGTQDAEGLDSLIDAINAVSQDFGCILAVTHIDDLKDAFSVRIQVTKTERGSEISIL